MIRLGLPTKIGLSNVMEKAQPEKKGKLEYFRQKILDHLSMLEKKEDQAIQKTFSDMEASLKKGYPVGTVRTWSDGRKYLKAPDGKWKPKYDTHSRGAKMAIAALKKKIAAAKDENEMMQLIFANRDRFEDSRGNPLPFVQELHKYIREQKTVKQPTTPNKQSDAQVQKQADTEERQKEAKPVDEKLSGFEKIQQKYQSAKAIEGDEDEIQIGRETMLGKWKLVEADTPTASHDEITFHKTPGFPQNTDGSTINDRDYGRDKAAQEAVLDIGHDFDGRALRVDNPVVVTNHGVVISGNNRTMSSKIAAKKGTDTRYIEALKKRAKKFGFTEEQISEFKNPRVVFEVQQEGNYTTEQFAQFNQSGKKEMGPTEKAVKVSKLVTTDTVKNIAEKIGEFETLGELYADRSAVQHIFNTFKGSGLIGEFELAKYIESGNITDDGKTFIETALLGSVMNESNIRGFNRPGCKSIRGILVRAITPLIENKSMGGYSITRELNEAADIAMQVAINRDKFKNVDEFSKQQSMFEKFDPVSIELAKKLEGTQKVFAEFMQKMSGSLKIAANGEADVFLGDVESKEDILGRFLPIKKAVVEIMNAIKGFFD